jgi:threonine/homoserine/homoserine lactone efflux protein
MGASIVRLFIGEMSVTDRLARPRRGLYGVGQSPYETPMTWPIATDKYLAFLAVMIAVAILPGPAILYAVASGMKRGARGALLATLGMNLAALAWFIASALGLVVVAATAPWAFRIAGWLGVAYIGWLGLDGIRGALRREAAAPKALREPGVSVFRDGFIVQVTNPKALLFFTAILPPFVEMNRPVWGQMAAFAVGQFTIDGFFMIAYGLLGAAFAHKMAEPGFRRIFSATVGAVLLAVAAMMIERLQ